MLPKPTHDSAPPSSRDRNYEKELSGWFERYRQERHAAPLSEAPLSQIRTAPPPREGEGPREREREREREASAESDNDGDWVDEPTTGRLPFLIY
jgi:hypothetical protein